MASVQRESSQGPRQITVHPKEHPRFKAAQDKAYSLARNTLSWFSLNVPFGVVTEVTHLKTTTTANLPEQQGGKWDMPWISRVG